MEINIKGLVIGETRLGDNKKFIRVLTEEYGCISVVAYGASSNKSKNFASARPFTLSSFNLTKKRDSYTLKEGAVIKSFFALGTDPKSLALASYIVSVAGFVSAQGEDSGELLSLTLNTLYVLSEIKKSPELIKAAFELKCAAVIGFAPALLACAKCSCDISHGGYFYVYEGECACEECKSRIEKAEYELVYKISPSVIAAMRYIVFSDIKKVFSFTVPDDEMETLSEISEKFLAARTENSFPALKVYKSL
ncbi:MAG: DNA repair protein RecO [Clostridia bacterium]|nr:DNA repair protein RecO [Clostridia bacterium]